MYRSKFAPPQDLPFGKEKIKKIMLNRGLRGLLQSSQTQLQRNTSMGRHDIHFDDIHHNGTP
jgi:hypothetical protein